MCQASQMSLCPLNSPQSGGVQFPALSDHATTAAKRWSLNFSPSTFSAKMPMQEVLVARITRASVAEFWTPPEWGGAQELGARSLCDRRRRRRSRR
jgi:hypothetical protein